MPSAINELVNEVMEFLKKCDQDFLNGIYNDENVLFATVYIDNLKKTKNNSNLINALINKMDFIRNQIIYHKNQKHENVLNFVPLSVTDYIIKLVKEKRITNPYLIARYVYVELCKVVYYDISYVKQESREAKRVICEAKIDEAKEKIFSYVVCTQWLKLYKYILKNFGIDVIEQNIPGEDHVWAEIKLDDNNIIIADATEYINNSIDLSNAKGNSPTSGFVVVPKEFSGLKLYNIFTDYHYKDLAIKVKSNYQYNRELDTDLGYVDNNGYGIEKIIKQNEIFNYPYQYIHNEKEAVKFLEDVQMFFKKIKIPNNMDGYELLAYYNKFIKQLPKNIIGCISQETLYVDSFLYKQTRMKDRFLKTPTTYIAYLEQLVYNRYYRYLKKDQQNELLQKFDIESFDGAEISKKIADYEMQIAAINRNLNLYYAINKLQFYKPGTGDTTGIYIYEPMMGNKRFETVDEYKVFSKKNGIIR